MNFVCRRNFGSQCVMFDLVCVPIWRQPTKRFLTFSNCEGWLVLVFSEDVMFMFV